MQSNNETNEKQPTKPNAFTLMKNVRDHCKQTGDKRVLMFVLATYCDRNGVCWPGNETLSEKMHVASRTVQRLLSQLAKDAEIEILQRGAGRNQRRYISLKRYLGTITKGDEVDEKTRHSSVVFKHDTCCRPNNQSEQPTPFSTPLTSRVGSRKSAPPPPIVFEEGKDSDLKCSKAIKTIIAFFEKLLRAKYPRFLPVNKLAPDTYAALKVVAAYPAPFRQLCQYIAKLIDDERSTDTFRIGNGQLLTINVPKGKWTIARLIYGNIEFWRFINPDLFAPEHDRARRPEVPKLRRPESAEAMYETLLGHEALLKAHHLDLNLVTPDYDGDFFNDMVDHDWRENGRRVNNWMAYYIGRIQKVMRDMGA